MTETKKGAPAQTPRPNLELAKQAGVAVASAAGEPYRHTREIFDDMVATLGMMTVGGEARPLGEKYRARVQTFAEKMGGAFQQQDQATAQKWGRVMAEENNKARDQLNHMKEEGTEMIPFELTSIRGNSVSMHSLLTSGPLVVIATRGDWCELCAMQCEAFAELQYVLQKSNATLVGLTATTPAQAIKMSEKLSVPFDILLDEGGKVMQQLGVAHKVSGAYVEMIHEMMGVDLVDVYGSKEVVVPAHSTALVIDQGGILRYIHASEDMRESLDIEEVAREVYISGMFPRDFQRQSFHQSYGDASELPVRTVSFSGSKPGGQQPVHFPVAPSRNRGKTR